MSSKPSMDDVNHIPLLLDQLNSLYLSDNYSDITLIIDGQRLPAHSVLLSVRCEYFRALIFGGLKELKKNEIELNVNSIEAFKHVLQYLYSGHIQLNCIQIETIVEILGLTDEYDLTQLKNSISEYLKKNISVDKVCIVYNTAVIYRLSTLADLCRTFIDKEVLDVISNQSFNYLSPNAMKELIRRDSFYAPEIDIFRSVWQWSKCNPSLSPDLVKEIMSFIRLPLISTTDLLKIVRNSGLFDLEVLLDTMEKRKELRQTFAINYRGSLLPEHNVATTLLNARVLKGENGSVLLDGNSTDYDSTEGYTHHVIEDSAQGLLIKLEKQYIINNIRVLLWDRDQRSYSYYIEISIDMKHWLRVIDHTLYLCRSWQCLYFPPRVAKYIRLVGTHNTANKGFHVVSFECMFTNDLFEVYHRLSVPTHNVCSVTNNAIVIEPVGSNGIINGNFKTFDWTNGFTRQPINIPIVVQLSQPVSVDSMRLLLWDKDERTYSFYVEVSVDRKTWTIIADKREEPSRSWQVFRFSRQPIVFIRIIGTDTTADDKAIHCVHLECPAQNFAQIMLSSI